MLGLAALEVDKLFADMFWHECSNDNIHNHFYKSFSQQLIHF